MPLPSSPPDGGGYGHGDEGFTILSRSVLKQKFIQGTLESLPLQEISTSVCE